MAHLLELEVKGERNREIHRQRTTPSWGHVGSAGKTRLRDDAVREPTRRALASCYRDGAEPDSRLTSIAAVVRRRQVRARDAGRGDDHRDETGWHRLGASERE